MEFAPQQNWQLYNALLAPYSTERAKSLTTSERFEIYIDYFDTVASAKPVSEPPNVPSKAWQEKAERRRRITVALLKWDESQREKIASQNTAKDSKLSAPTV